MNRWIERLRRLFLRDRVERENESEMRHHLEMEVRERMARGMSPEEARRTAYRDFGGVERHRQQARDDRWGRGPERLLQDLRFGLRACRRHPGFTAVVLLTVGLGVGSTTSIFSVVNAVLLSPLPYPDDHQLVRIQTSWAGTPDGAISPAEFLDYDERVESVVALGVYAFGGATFTEGEAATRVPTAFVSAGVLPALGVEPLMGRFFTPAEDAPGSGVTLVGEGFWRSALGSDPEVLGRFLQMDGYQVEVIGVMPESFRLPEDLDATGTSQLYFPMAIVPGSVSARGSHFLSGIARVRTGMTVAETAREFAEVASWMVATYPDDYPAGMEFRAGAARLADDVVGDARLPLLTLLGAVGFVLLIVCANVANLLLARAESRERELAVRVALGAGRIRVVKQLLAESVLLAALGGVIGVAVAYAGVDALATVAPDGLPQPGDIAVDGRVLAFAFGISLLVGVVFGLMPALISSRGQVSDALKNGARTSSGRGAGVRSVLVVGQVALAVLLVTGAGLFARSFSELTRVDPGFSAEGVLTAAVGVPSSRYQDEAEVLAFFETLVQVLNDTPGVTSAGASTVLPLRHQQGDMNFRIEGRPVLEGEASPSADWAAVTPGYFDAIGLPIHRGRGIEWKDRTGEAGAVVINETFALLHWPNENPIGKRFELGGEMTEPRNVEVVGVVSDVRHNSLWSTDVPQMYLPHQQFRFWSDGSPRRRLRLAVDSRLPAEELRDLVRSAVRELDPVLPVSEITTMEQIRRGALAQPKLMALLVGAFAGAALLLAALGVYGVLSYSVGLRTREFGVRMALGARPTEVSALVLRGSLRLIVAGAAIGLLVALLATRSVSGLLFEVSATDPVALGGTLLVLAAAGTVASLVPAARATRVDPVSSLKSD